MNNRSRMMQRAKEQVEKTKYRNSDWFGEWLEEFMAENRRDKRLPHEKVVDTTGCGDLFHTGFAVRWLETHDLMECQRFAAAVSAIKCRGLSGRPPSAPTRHEVEEFLKGKEVGVKSGSGRKEF